MSKHSMCQKHSIWKDKITNLVGRPGLIQNHWADSESFTGFSANLHLFSIKKIQSAVMPGYDAVVPECERHLGPQGSVDADAGANVEDALQGSTLSRRAEYRP